MVSEKYSIDLYMKDKFLFPNSYMEEVEKILSLEEKIYDIYYILCGDKFIINKYWEQEGELLFEILNCSKEYVYVVRFNINETFRVPSLSYLIIEIQDNNAMVKFGYNSMGVDYLRDNDFVSYEAYLEQVNTYGEFSRKIYAKNIVEMQMEADCNENSQKYEVLYIGQSKKENIFDRLNSHSTLQKIMRDMMRTTDNKEIYILIHSIEVKQFEKLNLEKLKTIIVLNEPLGRSFKLNEGINIEDVINVAEALLISHFKPPYNDKLKKSDGLEKLSTYTKIGEAEINSVFLTIDLYWERGREKMILHTAETQTLTKARWLECCFENDKVKVSYEDVPDCIY